MTAPAPDLADLERLLAEASEEVILRQGDPGYWGPPDAETIRRIEEYERAAAEAAAAALSDARSAGLIETAKEGSNG